MDAAVVWGSRRECRAAKKKTEGAFRAPVGKYAAKVTPVAAGPAMCASACSIDSASGISCPDDTWRERPIIWAVCHNASPLRSNGRKNQRSETIGRAAFLDGDGPVAARASAGLVAGCCTSSKETGTCTNDRPTNCPFTSTRRAKHTSRPYWTCIKGTRGLPKPCLLGGADAYVFLSSSLAMDPSSSEWSWRLGSPPPSPGQHTHHSAGQDGRSGNGKFHWPRGC